MATVSRLVTVLQMGMFLSICTPSLAEGRIGDQGHNIGSGGDKGGTRGTPAPIAGMGVLALSALGYVTRKLRKTKEKRQDPLG